MHIPDAVRALDRDLHAIFGPRLQSLVVYRAHAARSPTPTLAVLDRLTVDDLRACAARVAGWHEEGLATPLMLGAHEFERSLDAFPFEFGGILADHAVVSGVNPFAGVHADPSDLRRGCEVQARSLLLHLREGFIEAAGRSDLLAELVERSTGALAPLITSVARLLGETAADAAAAAQQVERQLGRPTTAFSDILSRFKRPITPGDARDVFPAYVEAVERLTTLIDRWSAR